MRAEYNGLKKEHGFIGLKYRSVVYLTLKGSKMYFFGYIGMFCWSLHICLSYL